MTFKEKLTVWGACNAALEWLGDRTERQQCADICRRYFFTPENTVE